MAAKRKPYRPSELRTFSATLPMRQLLIEECLVADNFSQASSSGQIVQSLHRCLMVSYQTEQTGFDAATHDHEVAHGTRNTN